MRPGSRSISLAAAMAVAALSPLEAEGSAAGTAQAAGTESVLDALPRVLPVDEAAENPDFFAFRAGLQRAVAARDTAAVMAVVDSTIKLSFGGDRDADRFRRMWLESSARDLWRELGGVLALGGRFMGDSMFVAPYTFHPFASVDDPPSYDPFDALIAIDAAVPVRASPESGADTLAVLSFHMVAHEWRADVADPPEGWTAVRLGDDSLGYVRSASVRSPIDYRAAFVRRDGRWRMGYFIAGD